MMDWLRKYNLADVVPFVEAVKKTRRQYYDDEIDILKYTVSIPGVSMCHVLNKLLKLNPDIKLYAPREPCKHKCEESCRLAERFRIHAINKMSEKVYDDCGGFLNSQWIL